MALASWAWLLAKEGKLGDVKDNARGLKMMLGRNGFVTRILPKMPLFWRKSYHPNKHDTKALEREWRERFFGDDGALLPELRNREAVTLH